MNPPAATGCENPSGSPGQRLLLIVPLALLSWLGMQAVHEAGHVLAAWATGGKVQHVELSPLRISRTDVAPNPQPRAVLWGGPLFGVVAPLAVWSLWRRRPSGPLWRFFAGFCLIANGAYLGSGVWGPVGDAFDLLREGESRWSLGLFGLVCVPWGVWMWDGLAQELGLKRGSGPISRRRLAWLWGLLALLLTVGLWGNGGAERIP